MLLGGPPRGLLVPGPRCLTGPGSRGRIIRRIWSAVGMGPSRRELGWFMSGKRGARCACFHLLREYRRNIGTAGFAAARRLLDAGSLAEGREWAKRIMRATARAAGYWCEKALRKGLRHLATGGRWGIGRGRV